MVKHCYVFGYIWLTSLGIVPITFGESYPKRKSSGIGFGYIVSESMGMVPMTLRESYPKQKNADFRGGIRIRMNEFREAIKTAQERIQRFVGLSRVEHAKQHCTKCAQMIEVSPWSGYNRAVAGSAGISPGDAAGGGRDRTRQT